MWAGGLGVGVVCIAVVALMVLSHRGATGSPDGAGPSSSESSPSTPLVTVDPSITALPAPHGVLPPELTATPATPGALIDEPTAVAVTKALVPLRMDALRRKDAATIELLEADDALEQDRQGSSYALPLPGTEHYMAYDALEQHHYPVNFVAEVRWMSPDNHSVVDLLVITRADAASRWKLSLEATFAWDDPILFLGATGQVPFDSHLSASTSQAAQELPAAMAAYWQSWADHGGPPVDTPFSTNGSLLDRGTAIVNGRRHLAQIGAARSTHYTRGTLAYSFPIGDHSTMVCSSVHWRSETTPAAGGALVQPDDRSEWGDLIAPGRYRSIETQGLRQSCFVATDGPAGVFGQNGDVFEATGTLAP